jgi:hypothetical protein
LYHRWNENATLVTTLWISCFKNVRVMKSQHLLRTEFVLNLLVSFEPTY